MLPCWLVLVTVSRFHNLRSSPAFKAVVTEAARGMESSWYSSLTERAVASMLRLVS